MPSQSEKAATFRALHRGPGAFIIPNPFDTGSARLLAGLGASALATTSGGFAGTLGRRDGRITRDEALAHSKQVVDAVDIPVAADLENGFGHAAAFAAETVRLAHGVGLVGCSIEDATGDPARPLYSLDEAVARIAACVAARPAGFLLTARTESFLRGNPDLDDVIRRLQAFAAAGADVLMAPGLPSLDAVRAVCAAVDRPVNFMAGIPGKSFSKAELQASGVRRISLATSLWRAAMAATARAATEALTEGTFNYLASNAMTPDINSYLR